MAGPSRILLLVGGHCLGYPPVITDGGVRVDRVVGVGCTRSGQARSLPPRTGPPAPGGDLDGFPRKLGDQEAGQRGRERPRLRRPQDPTLDPIDGGAPGHSGKDPLAHILWIRQTEPDVYRATFKFLEPVDWLNQRLSGRFAASHDSIALHW